MKKTQLIETLRNIKKQKVSYISIVLIAFFAVTAFLGVSFGSHSLAMGGSVFYDRQNFRDLEIVSSVLFGEKDIEKIIAVDGVKDAEGQQRTNAKLTAGGTKTDVTVLSFTERINQPVIRSGRIPESTGECAIESDTANELELKIGDTIKLDESENALPLLTSAEYTVTAILDHPDHLVVPNTFKGYVMVKAEAFDNVLLQGRSVLAQVVIEKPAGINRQSKKYIKLVDSVSNKLEQLSLECAEETLSDTWNMLEDYKAAIRETIIKKAISSAFVEHLGYSEEEARSTVDSASWAAKQLVPDLGDKNIDAKLFNILSDLSVKLPAKADITGFLESVLSGENGTFSIGKVTFPIPDLAKDQISALLAFVNSDDFSAYDQLLYAAEMWNTGHERYINTYEKLNNIKKGADEGIGVWVIMDPTMNVGFVHLQSSSDGIRALAIRFTSLFILVGAIVIYATIGKLVDEQRKQIGATKAFGFFNREIFAKYMIFGGSATLLGSILGTLSGFFLLQYFAVYSYSRYYLFDTPPLRAIPWQIVLVIVAGLVITFIAVWLASSKLIRLPAIKLMQDSIPAGKKKHAGKQSRLSLYQRLILRNMRTDIKRVVVTVVSIAGSTALIIIGFSIFLSVKTTITRQFDRIMKYDSVITLDKNAGDDSKDSISKLLNDENISHAETYMESAFINFNGKLEPADYIVSDIDEFRNFFIIKELGRNKANADYEEGVLVPGNYAQAYGLKIGDPCTLLDNDGNSYKAKIGGIFEFYLGKTVIMSPGAYEIIYGKPCDTNSVVIGKSAETREELREKLKEIEGFGDIARADEVRTTNESYSDLLAIMVVILVGAAAAMSAVILTNLVNIFILEKKRELTIMRVNGFTTKEVKNYVSREAILTTLLGIAAGIGFGLFMSRVVILALSKTYTSFILTPNIYAILLSAAITIVFTIIIYHIALRKIKDLKLTDIA